MPLGFFQTIAMLAVTSTNWQIVTKATVIAGWDRSPSSKGQYSARKETFARIAC